MSKNSDRRNDKTDRPDSTDGGVAVARRTRTKLERPKLYKVLLHNDDYTTMEFVVAVLREVFHHDEVEATRIMLHVHRNGVGVAGIFTYEIAEAKVRKTSELAREYQYPLLCTMEPEDAGGDRGDGGSDDK